MLSGFLVIGVAMAIIIWAMHDLEAMDHQHPRQTTQAEAKPMIYVTPFEYSQGAPSFVGTPWRYPSQEETQAAMDLFVKELIERNLVTPAIPLKPATTPVIDRFAGLDFQ